jgi:DNA (cytosine-5)-methyltransferase 1
VVEDLPVTAIDYSIYDRATRLEPINVVGFAGGGGSTKGYTLAGQRVHVALNHNKRAMAMHRQNHREAKHYIEDIRTVDPRVAAGLRRIISAWFSPDCRDFSKAKQGKPKSKRVRGLAWVIIHWINRLWPFAPEVIFLENVEEFADWCPLLRNGTRNKKLLGWFFRCFVGALQRRGYVVEWREQRACDYGAPTIRKRLFLIARRDGRPIVWPAATHGAPASEGVKAGLLKPYRTAAECIDFGRECPSIFLTRSQAQRLWRTRRLKVKRPLAYASLRRIALGVGRHVLKAQRPFILCLTHQGNDGVESIDQPFKTITGANRGERAFVQPVLAPFLTEHANASGQRTFSAAEPLRSQCAAVKGGHFALVSAMLARQFGTGIGSSVLEPMRTVMADGGGKTQLIATYLAQNNGGATGHQSYGHPLTDPISTVSGSGSHQSFVAASLVKYYGADQDPQMEDPLHSITTLDRFGLVRSELAIPPLTPELARRARQVAAFLRRFGVEFEGEFATVGGFVIVDIGMRMLVPRELYRAQGFPDDYVIDRGVIEDENGMLREIKLSGKDQVKMVGNSVSPMHAAAIIQANLSHLDEAAA